MMVQNIPGIPGGSGALRIGISSVTLTYLEHPKHPLHGSAVPKGNGDSCRTEGPSAKSEGACLVLGLRDVESCLLFELNPARHWDKS